jgi:homoserine O-acetyltransferase
LLREHLNIDQIYLGIGGSMGGQQLLEWAVIRPHSFRHLCLLATNAKHSPWGIAFNEAQRMALQADKSFGTLDKEAGRAGLASARAVAMLSYRHYETYEISQKEQIEDKVNDFKASSYQRYQGEKLWQRFSPTAYWILGQAMDSHNIGRQRGGVKKALASITAKALVIGIDTDVLFPVSEQLELATHIPLARLEIISSKFGHDGFLTETSLISSLLNNFINNGVNRQTQSSLSKKKRFLNSPLVLPGSETF